MPPPRTPRPSVPAETEHAQVAVALGAADQAGDLGGADVEHAERAGAHVRGARSASGPVGRHGGSTRLRTCRSSVARSLTSASACWRRRAAADSAARVGALRLGLRPQHQPVAAAACRRPAAGDRAARCPAAVAASRSSAGDFVPLRQQHVGAVVHAADSSAARRPAPRRRRAPASAGRSVSASSSTPRGFGCAGADDQRQVAELCDILVAQPICPSRSISTKLP